MISTNMILKVAIHYFNLRRAFAFIFIVIQIVKSFDPLQETRCLNCIRNVSSLLGIDVTKRCETYYCGQYQLSYTYWAEAGKPGNNHGSKDYEKCARDKDCAEQTVRAYFKKFKRDCNNDGLIDCLDMAALHKGGPASCASDWFYKSRFWVAFNKTNCMTNRDKSTGLVESDFDQLKQHNQRVMKNQTLTPECLDCICEATSGCSNNVNNCGSGAVCGPFAISQAYWKEGRQPGASWTACARTKECSSVTMKNYMEKHKRDCDDDGFITCDDYAAIHRRGPRACSNKDLLKDSYWTKFLACRANQKPSNDVNMVKVTENSDDSSSQTMLTHPSEITIQSSTIRTPEYIQVDYTQITSSTVKPSQHSSSSTTTNRYNLSSRTPTYDISPPGQVENELSRPQNSRPVSLTYDQHQHTSTTQETHQLSAPNKYPELSSSKSRETYRDHFTRIPDNDNQDNDGSRKSTPEHTTQPTNILDSKPQISLAWTPSVSTNEQQASISQTSTSEPSNKITETMSQTSEENSKVGNFVSKDNSSPVLGTVMIAFQPSAFSAIEQSKPQTTVEEIDYSASDFPFNQSGGERATSFDKVVSGIMGDPDFSKSYPPLPDLVIQGKQSEQAPNSNEPHFNQSPQKSQQKFNTNHSRNPYQPVKTIELAPPKYSSKQSNQKQPAASVIQQSSNSNLRHQEKNSDDIQSLTASMVGNESLNVSVLFEKSLNESSRIGSECLECICDASSNCDTTVQCISKQREKNRCGLYMISWNQYQESDISLTSLLPPPAGLTEEIADEKMYYDCAIDRVCAERLIHLYIEKHQKDCNGDGRIDCYDIAAIHRVGPEQCNSGKFLESQYWKDFNICYNTERTSTTVDPQVGAQLH